MDSNMQAINSIRVLAAEAIEKAASGHPGLPLGAAPAAYTLWHDFLKHNPLNPDWPDRDRFILSAGHGSALLYSLLHLFGYGLTMEDMKRFRQLGSPTPGHPEYRYTKGVEITTGPLGQGIANAVGMALAENYLAAKFNREGFELVNHYTYALCGDGCLMEGISYEAASLAGTLGLNKLVLLYDSNNITIEGSTDIAFREDVLLRFKAAGWNTALVRNGNDCAEIASALAAAKQSDKPTLIEIKTQIGFGAPNKQGKSSAHGEPLGADELILLKQGLGADIGKEFHIAPELYERMSAFRNKVAETEDCWNKLLERYKNEYPDLHAEWLEWFSDKEINLIDDPEINSIEGRLATRVVSGRILNRLADIVPNLIGGSADLGPSNNSVMKQRGDYSKENRSGSNLHFGVREHAMTAIVNGMAAHGGLRPYAAGFFVFSDYMKPALRMSALMGLPAVFVLTHDSIGVGEDGPTHQPIEHLSMLRGIPGMTVIRPADARETAAAWQFAINSKNGPVALVLSRQALDPVDGTGKAALHGAYIIKDSQKPLPDIILIATGSELGLVCEAYAKLQETGIDARVVSMPSMEIFERQSAEYKERVLPRAVRTRLAVEAAAPLGWDKYTGLDGGIIAMNGFGASAPGALLFKKFGFTVENIVKTAMDMCN